MKIITGYTQPDIDFAACAYAYAELLNSIGEEAVAAAAGQLRPEVQFVFDKLGLSFPKLDDVITDKDEVILVDASEAGNRLSPKIDIDKVVEVIDHRKVNDSHLFKNAKLQIEAVGSCATLITEKIVSKDISLSDKAAELLNCAIIANTIIFQAKVTTDRDRKMSAYLQEKYHLSGNLAHEMFVFHSKIEGPLKKVFLQDLASNTFAGQKICTFQLEIIGVDDFVQKNLEEIKRALIEINQENNYDHTWLTCIDIEGGRNTFVVAEQGIEEIVSKSLDIRFENGVGCYPEVIMRKEILPKIKAYLEV